MPSQYRGSQRRIGGRQGGHVSRGTITGEADSTPASTSVAAGSTLQFQIAIGWSDGAWPPATTSFTATGGTITIDGLYSAGSVIGTFAVIATCSCGAVDTSLVSVTVGTTPVLTVFQLSPTNFSLAPGASQQLGISYAWSNGDIAAPLVSFSASGGSVSPEGLYIAPPTAGSYEIVASHLGGVLKDTSLVTVTAPESPPLPPPPPPDGLYPNRPANYTTVVSDYAFNGPLPANGASGAMPDGSGWRVINTSHYMSTVNDSMEPTDGGNTLDWLFDVHADNGLSTSYGHFNFPVPSGITDWYVAFSVWHSANAQLNPVSNKLFEWIGPDPQGLGSDFMIQTAGQDGFWEFNAQRVNPTAVKNSQRFLPNLNPGPSPKGQWVTVEILVHFGTTANFDCWLNGVHTHHYTGLTDIYIPSGGSEFTLNSTWGGAGGAITQAWHRRVGHILIAHP